jgi:hypothetical protein
VAQVAEQVQTLSSIPDIHIYVCVYTYMYTCMGIFILNMYIFMNMKML